MIRSTSIGVAVITLNAEKHLNKCLAPFFNSPLKPKILVLDSSSDDNTVKLAQQMGASTYVIPRNEFNHGTTREKARKLLNTDIVVMLTQDAYAQDESVLEKLVKPLQSGKASISYARQIPHDGADIFESFPRIFNYPAKSQIRDLEDIPHYGVYTFFCSNSCAAYLNKALDQIGGFKHLLFGEDTYAAAELIHQGHKIAYVAEAEVKHSHRYTLKQEFKRNFDIGLSRQQLQHLITCAGCDEKRGAKYLSELTKHLIKNRISLLPYAYLQTGFKWLGYRLGRISTKAPIRFKKALSSQKFFWDNK